MKHIKIDEKRRHVFVLRENDTRLVFIAADNLDKIDFGRLYELEKRTNKSTDLLDLLRDETLSNGNNGLKHFSRLIRLSEKDDKEQYEIREDGTRVEKKEEQTVTPMSFDSTAEILALKAAITDLQNQAEANATATAAAQSQVNEVDQRTQRKKPGPKPKKASSGEDTPDQ